MGTVEEVTNDTGWLRILSSKDERALLNKLAELSITNYTDILGFSVCMCDGRTEVFYAMVHVGGKLR